MVGAHRLEYLGLARSHGIYLGLDFGHRVLCGRVILDGPFPGRLELGQPPAMLADVATGMPTALDEVPHLFHLAADEAQLEVGL